MPETLGQKEANSPDERGLENRQSSRLTLALIVTESGIGIASDSRF
jgi:hypothetical protein